LSRLRTSIVALFVLTLVGGFSLRADEPAKNNTIREARITKEDREHWAFRKLVRPAVPRQPGGNPLANPIDAFIGNRLRRDGLTPLPPAGRVTLIRRLTFDLTGLPPTPEEVEAYVDDRSPDAHKRLVDRLLASPAYGERWAQHWLDLARWAETDGFEHDKLRADAWRYRDWVIKALNDDMPYNRFVSLQLAGDELSPGDAQAKIATAFCLAGPDMPDINSQEERRHLLLNEMTAAVSAVFLGLQTGCAQCHDHKYDPISQADFYRLRSVFQPAVHLRKDKSVSTLAERGAAAEKSFLMIRGDWRRPGARVQPAFLRIANPWNDEVKPLASGAKTSGRRTAMARWLTRPDHPLTTRVIVNRLWQHHFVEGLCRTPSDFGVMGDEPEHPELLDWLATELVRRKWSLKAIHRLIVASATYRRASRPGDPSWTDQQVKAARESWGRSRKVDPGNHLLARFPRRRLEGEAIRDAMLLAAGVLNRAAGGPGVRPPLPREVVGLSRWVVSPNRADHVRRSIYVFARRNLRYPLFEAFDRPDGNASCARRTRSTTAPQSLFLINSKLSLDAARRLAGYVMSSAANDVDARVTLCFRRALSRPPTRSELELARQFVTRQQAMLEKQRRSAKDLALPDPCPDGADPYAAAALVDLALAMFNLNEFIYVD
jgi:hypothetical protein